MDTVQAGTRSGLPRVSSTSSKFANILDRTSGGYGLSQHLRTWRGGPRQNASSADRSGANALAAAILDHLRYHQAVPLEFATSPGLVLWRWRWHVRDRMLDRSVTTLHAVTAPKAGRRIMSYLSAEFLAGPHLGDNLLCLGMQEAAQDALSGSART